MNKGFLRKFYNVAYYYSFETSMCKMNEQNNLF